MEQPYEELKENYSIRKKKKNQQNVKYLGVNKDGVFQETKVV